MDTLIYLLPPSLSSSPEPKPPYKIQRALYTLWPSTDGDENFLERVSFKLLHLNQDKTYDAIRRWNRFGWRTINAYDVVNPFGDSRQTHYHSLWIFDTENDVLLHTNRDRRSRIPLVRFRERIVTLADMEPLGPPVPLPAEPTIDTETTFWKPEVDVDGRTRALTHRLLRDFNHQWRHVLRNDYNRSTLRVLARAVIRLATLDIQISEEEKWRPEDPVEVQMLPRWQPFKSDIVLIGNVHVVICPTIEGGLSVARQHAMSQGRHYHKDLSKTGVVHPQAHYMILSVKHIVLGRVNDRNMFEYTAPERLFNGNYYTGPPSDLALGYLTWATAGAIESVPTPCHSLPVEIQDVILGHLSDCVVANAQTGCLLGLGTPFLWKDGPVTVALRETYPHPTTRAPRETQLWIDWQESGLVYKCGEPEC